LGLRDDGERVVAQLGQDVHGLPDDPAGLGQAGPVRVVAVLDLAVVAVAGGAATRRCFAASNSSQRSTSGPCRDSRPGLRLPSEECTVTSSPTNRTALRDEVNRPAPPSQAHNARPVIGPTP
jgi:hypothetical protein